MALIKCSEGNLVCRGFCLPFILGLFGSLYGGNSAASPAQTVPPHDALVTEQIPYEVVEHWTIPNGRDPNGGNGRAIVVAPQFANEADLKRLAQQLAKLTSQDNRAVVLVYDNKIAASRRMAAFRDELGKKEAAHYDAHFIASYIRNANTGYHAITITIKGVNKEIPL